MSYMVRDIKCQGGLCYRPAFLEIVTANGEVYGRYCQQCALRKQRQLEAQEKYRERK